MKINFGQIPKEWKLMKLVDCLSSLESGSRAEGGTFNIKEGIPSLGGEHITQEGQLDLSDIKYIPHAFYESMKAGKVRENDILLVKDGATTGKVTLIRYLPFPSMAVNEHIFILRTKSMITQNFLFYILSWQKIQNQIKRVQAGSAQPGINSSFAKHILIPIPTAAEQKKITSILTTLSDISQKTSSILNESEKFNHRLLQHFLSQGVKHHRLKHTDLGTIPNDWKITKLSQILLDVRYGTSSKAELQGEGFPVLGIPNIIGGEINQHGLRRLEASREEVKSFLLHEGDILIVRTNANPDYIGRCALFEDIEGEWLYASYLIRIRVNKDIIFPKFLVKFLQSNRARRMFLRMARTSAGNYNININDLGRILIPLPPYSEQKEIANILSDFGDGIQREVKKKLFLENLSKGLMQVLLQGKVRVE